jgi:pimeloyl-ACP methyl ester carboxylesterase
MLPPATLDPSRHARQGREMIERTVTCIGPQSFHRLAYVEWPGPSRDAPVLLCVHGLTRNGRDFDILAQALSAHYRVVCPDMPGRGKSDWLGGADYTYPLYLADLTTLIGRLDVERVDWVGTSMGGIIGMLFAAMPNAPIGKLVMNDIGARVPKAGLERIASYVGLDPSFPGLADLETALRLLAAPFGPLSDAQWRHLATHSVRRKPDGTIGFAYDPNIAHAFRQSPIEDVALWAVWDAITCPVLVLRGTQSDILAAADAAAMTQRGPRAKLIEFAGIGHAPALMAEDQIAAIRDFLLGDT